MLDDRQIIKLACAMCGREFEVGKGNDKQKLRIFQQRIKHDGTLSLPMTCPPSCSPPGWERYFHVRLLDYDGHKQTREQDMALHDKVQDRRRAARVAVKATRAAKLARTKAASRKVARKRR